MNVAYRLVRFGVDAPPSAQDLARLHATLLPTSPLTLLGHRFMEQFYYRLLPREGLILGAIAYVDNCPAGFVAATHDSAGFMRTVLYRRWPALLWVVGTSMLLTPKFFRTLWRARCMMAHRPPAASQEAAGEILSLGVLPAYREPRFIRRSGLHIATDLLDSAIMQLQGRGTQVIRALVEPGNTAAKLFYGGLGWRLQRAEGLNGPTSSVELVWRA